MNNTKKVCYLAVLTAMYVVLSAFLRFNLIGNIQVDLGYIAFTVALCMFGVYGAIVGVVGCALESLLFSAYGFSIGWAVANVIIGVVCGFVFSKTEKTHWRIVAIIVSVAVGMIVAKTAIECYLYSIPIAVKIPKSIVAFVTDAIVMILGLGFHGIIDRWMYPNRQI